MKYWRWGDSVALLATVLERGGIVGIPTESSYGLAVDPRSERGVAAVYGVKGRHGGKPLPVVVADLDQAGELGVRRDFPGFDPVLPHWPGPLTLIAPTTKSLPAAAGGESLALRIPGHPRLRQLLLALGTGLTATSANRSTETPALDPVQVGQLLGNCDAVIIDDGRLPGGPPSTMVSWGVAGLEVVRQGRVSL